jgi:RND family efflux transporter MFP subunit
LKMQLLLLSLVLFLYGCSRTEHAENPTPEIVTPSETVRVEGSSREVVIAATVRASDVAQLASRFGGFVNRIAVRSGDVVKRGDLLVLMDDHGLQAQRQKALAGKEQAIQSAEASRAQSQLASTTFDRIRVLYERKSASRQEFDEAESRKNAAESAYQAVLKQVDQAESDLKDVQANSEYFRIVAPFDGMITSVPVDTGTFVNPGQPLVSMENPVSFQAVFAVEEQLLEAVQRGNRISVLIPAISDHPEWATVQEVNPSADTNTRTFQVKANLASIPKLRSGLSARVFLSSMKEQSLWIPEKFLDSGGDLETVLVHQQNGWLKVLVKSGERRDGKVEILAGLNAGEEIGIVEKRK